MIKFLAQLLYPLKTPRYIQMENTECGAAVLGMILGYYGKHLPLQELRETCGVSRDGLSLEELENAALYYGLDVEVSEALLENLPEVTLPAILFWDYNHFIVLESLSKEKTLINDPRTGHRTISQVELTKGFSGFVMEFQPGKSFTREGKKATLLSRAFEKIAPYKKDFHYLFLIQLGITLLGLVFPVSAQIFIDRFFGPIIPEWKWKFLGLVFGIVLFTGLLTWVLECFLNCLQVRLAIRLSSEFLWKIIRLPTLFFTQRFSSELVNRMTLNSQIGQILTRDLMLNSLSILLLSSYWVIMLFYSVPITVCAAIVALFNIGLIWYFGKVRSNSYAKLQQSEAQAVGISFDALEHIETMKGNALENFFFTRIANSYTASINNNQEIGKKDLWNASLSKISLQISTIFILGFGSWEVIHGSLTIGKLIALQILYNLFLQPVLQLVSFSTQIQSVEVDLTRLDDVLKAKSDPILNPRSDHSIDTRLKGAITFDNVHFSYKKLSPPFIKGLNLEIKPGEMIGLTGANGSGKTTLARLATSLLQPQQGEVLYDGKPYQDYTRETLTRSIAIVDQLTQFFPGTIRENLTMWNETIPDSELVNALQKACVDEEVATFSKGIFTPIEENAANLSGGQRQRLEIARVLLTNPSFLILDEATNAIGSLLEAKLLSHIRSLKITTLLIAHRLSIFKLCDRILVLSDGQIVQEGTHETLSKTPGPYQKLLEYEIQTKL